MAMNSSSFFAYLFFLFFNYFLNLSFFCLFVCFVLGFYLLLSFLYLNYLILSFFFLHCFTFLKKLTFLPCFFSSSNPLRSPSQIQVHNDYGLTLSPYSFPYGISVIDHFLPHNMRIEAAGSSEMLVSTIRLSGVIFQNG